jgi:hypothetical protein
LTASLYRCSLEKHVLNVVDSLIITTTSQTALNIESRLRLDFTKFDDILSIRSFEINFNSNHCKPLCKFGRIFDYFWITL